MGAKKVKITDVHTNTGLSRNTITELYYERVTRIDYNTINQLCQYLQCSVGELLEYVPEKN